MLATGLARVVEHPVEKVRKEAIISDLPRGAHFSPGVALV